MDENAETREIPTATPLDQPEAAPPRPLRPDAPTGWNAPPRRKGRLGLALLLLALFGLAAVGGIALLFWLALREAASVGAPGLAGYVQFEEVAGRGRDRVLLVDIDGVITSRQGCAPLATALLRQLHKENKPADVKAVLLRVNSPGGTVTACDNLDAEIRKCQKKGIAFLAFHDELAASGGYYVSARCKPIIARPTCVVGSIGVIGMNVNIEKLLRDKLGVEAQTIKSSDAIYKDVPSMFRPMTDDERKYVQKMIDDYHARFVGIVRAGRGLTAEEVAAFANGKVFLPDDALRLKMIDKIGDWDDAVDAARKVAGPDAPVIGFRRRPSAFQMMMEARRESLVPEDLRLKLDLAARQSFCYLWLP